MIINISEKNLKLEIETENLIDFFEILNDIREFKLFQFQELKTGLEELFSDVDDELKQFDTTFQSSLDFGLKTKKRY